MADPLLTHEISIFVANEALDFGIVDSVLEKRPKSDNEA